MIRDDNESIAQLMGCWMKAWELDKLADIEKRLTNLEKERERKI